MIFDTSMFDSTQKEGERDRVRGKGRERQGERDTMKLCRQKESDREIVEGQEGQEKEKHVVYIGINLLNSLSSIRSGPKRGTQTVQGSLSFSLSLFLSLSIFLSVSLSLSFYLSLYF